MSFITGTQTELLYAQEATSTKATFSTQAIISATSSNPRCILPANFWQYQGIGRSIMIEANGVFSTTVTPTLALALCFDTTPGTINAGTTFTGPAVTTASSVTNACWSMELQCVAQTVGSAGSTVQIDGTFLIGTVAKNTNTAAAINTTMVSTTVSLNSEVSYCIELAATWSASSASNTISVTNFFVFGCN